MYYPFERDGNRVPFPDITEADIERFLTNANSESIYFEFKETLDNNVRSKIGQLFSSFANERGGFVIIGVRDTDKTLVGIEDCDCDQIIGNIIKSKVSPVLFYQLRVIALSSTVNKVILVYVPEGVDGPYIVDGTIYRRIGSNSIGLQKIKDRYDLDTITAKAEKKRESFKSFCKPKVDVYDREWFYNQYSHKGYYRYYSVLNFYYILPDVQPNEYLLLESADVRKNIFDTLNATVFPKNCNIGISFNVPFPRYSFAQNSLVFRNHNDHTSNSRGIIFHINRNGWVRVHLPLQYLNWENITNDEHRNKLSDSKEKVLNGQDISKAVFTILHLLEHLRSSLFPSHNRYILDVKGKYLRNKIVYFNGCQTYSNYFDNTSLPLIETDEYRLNPEMWVSDSQLDWISSLTVIMSMMMAFNLPHEDGVQMFIEALVSK